MNISFDLDSTLIPHGNEFESEKLSTLAQFFGIEQIRKGAPELIAEIQDSGHRVYIYTSSFRSKGKIRRTLRYYGIRVYRIINAVDHQRELKVSHLNASKYPPAFGIDLHIDDSKGLEIEAGRYDFKVMIIEPSDSHWKEKIKAGITSISEKPNSPSMDEGRA